jgi:hypothetical protein
MATVARWRKEVSGGRDPYRNTVLRPDSRRLLAEVVAATPGRLRLMKERSKVEALEEVEVYELPDKLPR